MPANEHLIIQPDIEVRVLVGGVERVLFGLFVGDSDQVDVGMGIDPDCNTEGVAASLETCAEALRNTTNWYDKDSLLLAPNVVREIKEGRTS